MMRPATRCLAAVLFVLGVAALMPPAPALAHAVLINADPAEGASIEGVPSRVRLFFNEPIEPDFFALEVYNPDRQRVDRRDAHLAPDSALELQASLGDLSPGTYTVVWRVLSIDGHVVRGTYAFGVGGGATPGAAIRSDAETAAPAAMGATVRWLTYLAAFMLFGGFAFVPLVLGPASHAAGVNATPIESSVFRRFLWVAWTSVVLLLLLGLASLLPQASDASGVPVGEVLGGRAVTRLLSGTKFGLLWIGRMGLLVAVLGVVGIATGQRTWRAWSAWSGVVLGALFLLALAASGHASSVQERTALTVAADWLHLLAGAMWVGGLAQLTLALPIVAHALDAQGRRQLMGPLIRRFSFLGGMSVAVLALTGTYASLVQVASWTGLLDTVYGAVLSGKLLVFSPLLILAAVNLLVLHPRFVRAAASATGRDDLSGRRLFRWLVGGELTLAVCILALTGVLSGLAPATTVPLDGRPFQETKQTPSGLAVTLDVSPNQAGDNRIEIVVTGSQGRPAPEVDQVALTMVHQQMDMGAREVVAQSTGDGRFEARGGYLSMTGPWQVAVQLGRAGGAEETVTFAPTLGQAPGANRPAFSPARIVWLAVTDPGRERGLPVNPRLLLALVAIGAAVAMLARCSGVRRKTERRRLATAGVAFVALGMAVGGADLAELRRI